MALRRILQVEIPEDYTVLKTKATRVTTFDAALSKLVDDMIETMNEADGVGLAAPQIGVLRRVIVVQEPAQLEEREDGTIEEIAPPQLYVMINPEIIKSSEETFTLQEGCLSLPGRYGDVPRPSWITVKYQDLKGKEQRVRHADATAIKIGRIVQHEVDHLDGILFTERIVDMSTLVDYRESNQPRRRRGLLRRKPETSQENEAQP